MGSVLYMIAIMGCGDGSAACTQVRVEPARYASMAQCQAAMPAVLSRSSDIDFPELSAACRPSGSVLVDAGHPPRRG